MCLAPAEARRISDSLSENESQRGFGGLNTRLLKTSRCLYVLVAASLAFDGVEFSDLVADDSN